VTGTLPFIMPEVRGLVVGKSHRPRITNTFIDKVKRRSVPREDRPLISGSRALGWIQPPGEGDRTHGGIQSRRSSSPTCPTRFEREITKAIEHEQMAST
jgi:hypothetical protein